MERTDLDTSIGPATTLDNHGLAALPRAPDDLDLIPDGVDSNFRVFPGHFRPFLFSFGHGVELCLGYGGDVLPDLQEMQLRAAVSHEPEWRGILNKQIPPICRLHLHSSENGPGAGALGSPNRTEGGITLGPHVL